MEKVKGYKAFDADLMCRGMQYEVGKEFTADGELKVCGNGLHFCAKCGDVFDYYDFDPERTRVCEVEALGKVETEGGKSCTDRLKVVRELAWEEVLRDANSGYRNSGYRNSGNWNSGDRNSGDWNATNFSAGVLCTEEPECLVFDEPSGMTLREWRDSEAAAIMLRIEVPYPTWRDWSELTDEERETHAKLECQGGMLVTPRDCGKPDFEGWWAKLDDAEKRAIFAIPNFDCGKWQRITGLDVREEVVEL